MDLELKVLTISRQERPPENTQVDFSPHDAAEPRRNKRNID